ncbi:MAG: FAD-dependent oxidoreductase [Candidatus Omnitrophota bacterium]
MSVKKIIIIGCGFAGSSAAAAIRARSRDALITVIDKAEAQNFMPLLPDTLGRGIDPAVLTYPIIGLCKQYRFAYINNPVKSVDLDKRKVITTTRSFDYDYLLISSGSETNFYGNDRIMINAFKLDDARDAGIIRNALQNQRRKSYLIAGGGYTGIEVATNLRCFLSARKDNAPVIILERAGDILGPLPGWMKDYVRENLKALGIGVMAAATVESIDNRAVTISGGKVFNDSMLIWAAGVRTADFIQAFKAQKNPQGRVSVDQYLRLSDNCFIAGDAAGLAAVGGMLRMAVQFAITQGDCAGRNIVRSIEGRPLLQYRPVDLGYVIPMANNRSCGIIMGKKVSGVFPTALHYGMCIYRSRGLRNRSGIIRQLLTGR